MSDAQLQAEARKGIATLNQDAEADPEARKLENAMSREAEAQLDWTPSELRLLEREAAASLGLATNFTTVEKRILRERASGERARIIFRNSGDEPHTYLLTPAYDALGGFMIAKSLIATNRKDKSFNWLKHSKTTDLFINKQQIHELSSDIFRSLVSLTPMLAGTQLWKVAPEILKKPAIRLSTILAPKHLDSETVEALQSLFINNPEERPRLFPRLLAIRAAASHPLNAEFLDKILRLMARAGERDLSWTEWIRRYRDERLSDIIDLEEKWKSHPDRQSSDRLRLKWLMWHLTSTDHELRNVTTRALYWFGRGDPSMLFDETIKSLDINDPYVPERMLAASYGVAMAHQGSFE